MIVTAVKYLGEIRAARRTVVILAAAACVAAGSAQSKVPGPSRAAATAAVKKYLQQKGNLCLGKFTWPIDVTELDRRNGTNDALQMPVLERLGLVVSSVIPAEQHEAGSGEAGAIKRYALTVEGRKYYLQKKMTSLGPGDAVVEHSGDLCVATLSLDKVVKWNPPELVNGHQETIVAYTYRIVPAAWTSDPEVRKVFPRVDMVIRGERTLQLKETFQLESGNWIPSLPGQ